MTTHTTRRTLDLIDRLTRLANAEDWSGDLNPAQHMALSYLRQANRFSRAPSQVADYLATTRGTASQTLKALARKGYIQETRSPHDRRSIAYQITAEGLSVLSPRSGVPGTMETALDAMPEPERAGLANGLELIIRQMLSLRGERSFGLCATCRHHDATPDGLRCHLLGVSLAKEEADQICHEHALPLSGAAG